MRPCMAHWPAARPAGSFMHTFLVPSPPHCYSGLGIRAQNAKMKLTDGYSEQSYWLTDLKGRKVSSDQNVEASPRDHRGP